jgi:dehydrogenase/reductase SDR family member 12
MTDPRAVVDGILEFLVLPSFTRTGYTIRRRLFGWDDPEAVDLAGRTVVITGPTSGLGRAAAGSFARMGARLILVGRSAERLDHTRDELVSEAESAGHPPSVATVVADLGSLASVRTGAAAILESEPRIDVLIDNAGAMFPTREVTDEGFERSFAIMVLGPFVLLSHLLTRLAESPDPRVVAVTSGGMYTQRLPLDDLMFERGTYGGPQAYARAKRAQVALVREWARRLRDRGVVVNAMHPGWADTPGLTDALPGFHRFIGGNLRSADEGADTIVWLAAAPEARARSGALFLDRRPRPFDRVPATRLSADDRRRLWDAVAGLTGETDPLTGDA